MDSPPAEPLKEENKDAFLTAITDYQSMIEKVSVIEDAQELFNLL